VSIKHAKFRLYRRFLNECSHGIKQAQAKYVFRRYLLVVHYLTGRPSKDELFIADKSIAVQLVRLF
jgi:hypothetical protein